jgi:hypothetical protein
MCSFFATLFTGEGVVSIDVVFMMALAGNVAVLDVVRSWF